MVTRADVRWARTEFERHCAEHKCKARECEIRLRLWRRISQLALQWERT